MVKRENSTQRPADWHARPAMETKPPKFVMRLGNVVMKRMLRGKMGDSIMLITFTGRKSGKTFTTAIGYTREGNTLTAFTDSPWQKNLIGGAPVTITIKGKEIKGHATPLSDQDQLMEYVKRHLQSGDLQAPRRMGVSLPQGYLPTDDELRIILRDRMLISIELQDSK